MNLLRTLLRRVKAILTGLTTLAIACARGGLAACFPKKMSTAERLAAFPRDELPLRGAVTIYWNEHLVPFIHAEYDRDLAFCLGLVHAHLRGAQLAVMKRLSQGRLAEMAGPPAVDLDHTLRILNLGFAAKASFEAMPVETRQWLKAFVAGLNHHQERVRPLPPELAFLGIEPEPYTPEDIITLSRLAGADVNWLCYFSLLRERMGLHWREVWDGFLATGNTSTPSFGDRGAPQLLAEWLAGNSRSGSNSLVVAPGKTNMGGGAIGNDPHVGQSLPNLWLLAGYRSPSYHAVGLMFVGLPFLGLGRNPHLAWGGTNMGAASSDLYDVSDLPPSALKTREELIRVRFGRNRKIRVRQSICGPVLSDSPLIAVKTGECLALRWVGHQVSDEITAFLYANRARDPHSFRAAFAGRHAVSGQNLLCVDHRGNIGMISAVRLPLRGYHHPPDLVLDACVPEHEWRGYMDAGHLPWSYNPPEGFLASANNRPVNSSPPIGYFFTNPDRIDRLKALLGDGNTIGLTRLKPWQRDVYMASAHQLARVWVRRIVALGLEGLRPELFEALAGWDGYYRAQNAGPAAFELLTHDLVRGFQAWSGKRTAYFQTWKFVAGPFARQFQGQPDALQRKWLRRALRRASRRFRKFPTWGHWHRLPIAHFLAGLPLIGRFFVFADLPASGSRETLMKTDHGLVRRRHASRYGSQARHISVMDDPDHNFFVLLGGQDGWLGSPQVHDQVSLWEQGKYIQLPLRLETVQKTCPHVMKLAAKPASNETA